MNEKKRLFTLCAKAMQEKGLAEQKYKDRLQEEWQEIDAQNEFEYFLDLYDRGIKIEENENNLLVPYLLEIVDNIDINKPPEYVYGDLPDIDVDYIPEIRDYLKNEWAPKTFGREYVSNIGSYNTFGVKNALIDMARVHGLDRDEVLKITTKLSNKDDDGEAITWETAVAGNKELEEYCKKYPEVADAARRLVGRIRGKGKHAGGLIVSSVPIDSIVPQFTDSDGNPASAWTEGLNSQDLQPVGLVKFDLLVITNLKQIKACIVALTKILNKATESINSREGLICALPGGRNWSDTSYLNDPMALALANEARLKCIFQFDSSGIRDLVKQGGVTSFEDLVAYASLYRPGPLSCLPKGTQIQLNSGTKSIEELNSDKDKVAYLDHQGMIQHTSNFIMENTGIKKVYKIKTKSGKTIIASGEHRFMCEDFEYKKLKNIQKGEKVYTLTVNEFIWDEIESIENVGEEDCYDIAVLEEDVFLDEPNYIAENFLVHNSGMATNYCDRKRGIESYNLHPLLQPILEKTYGVMVYQEQVMQILNAVGSIPLKDCEIVRKAISKKQIEKFIKYKDQFIEVGQKKLEWDDEKINELFDNVEAFSGYGFNRSHAVAYTMLSSRLLWLKAHYPLDFFAAILSCEKSTDKIKEYKLDANKFGIEVNRVDLNKSKERFQRNEDQIYAGFADIKGIGEDPAAKIVAGQPYSSFEDFLERFGTDANTLKPLISLGIFCDLEQRADYWEFAEYYKDKIKSRMARDARNVNTRQKHIEEFMYLIPEGHPQKYEYDFCREWIEDKINLNIENEDFVQEMIKTFPEIETKQSLKIYKKLKKCIEDHQRKVEEDEPILLKDFRPIGKISQKMKDMLMVDVIKAEEEYYGFSWTNLLEKSPDYKEDYTFAEFERRVDLEDAINRPVYCHVVKPPLAKTSKSGTTTYYVVTIQDGEGHEENVTFWEEDYNRFKEELEYWEDDVRKGNLLVMRLVRPAPPFKNYTFESPAKHERKRKVPENKADDARLSVLERPDIIEIIQRQNEPEVIEI